MPENLKEADLDAISWECVQAKSATLEEWTLYFMNYDNVKSGDKFPSEKELTRVYHSEGETLGEHTGWYKFNFEHPFHYDGSKYLLVVLYKKEHSNGNGQCKWNCFEYEKMQFDTGKYDDNVNRPTNFHFDTHEMWIPVARFGNANYDPLPIEMASVKNYEAANNNTYVEWTTLSEKNCSHFVVESASEISENTEWNVAEYIPTQSVDGNSIEKLTYTFVDYPENWENGYPATTYYRILQYDVDNDEPQYVSEILAVNHKKAGMDGKIKVDVYPNPFASELTIEVNASTEVTIYDVKGVMMDTFEMSAGKHFMNLDYQAGTYFIKIGDEVRTVVKM